MIKFADFYEINMQDYRLWWQSGLTYYVIDVNCYMVCIRSQVRIPPGDVFMVTFMHPLLYSQLKDQQVAPSTQSLFWHQTYLNSDVVLAIDFSNSYDTTQ